MIDIVEELRVTSGLYEISEGTGSDGARVMAEAADRIELLRSEMERLLSFEVFAREAAARLYAARQTDALNTHSLHNLEEHGCDLAQRQGC